MAWICSVVTPIYLKLLEEVGDEAPCSYLGSLALLVNKKRGTRGVPRTPKEWSLSGSAVHLDGKLGRWLMRLLRCSHIAEFMAMAGSPPPLLCLQGSLHSLLFDL